MLRPTLAAALFCFPLACKTDDDVSALRDDPVPPPQDLSPKESFERWEKIYGDVVHELHVHMRGDTFAKVVTHMDQGGDACKDNARYGHVEKLVFTDRSTNETHELQDVGIRVRGNTSCGNFRKSFRLKLDADAKELKNAAGEVVTRISRVFRKNGEDVSYAPADKERVDANAIHGVKTFSLRTSTNDPTLLREKLSSEVFAFGEEVARQKTLPGAADRGGAVYRAGFVRVFLHRGNGKEDFGLYNLTEQVDKTLFRTRWGKDVTYSFQANLARAPLRDLPTDLDELFTNYEPGLVDGDGFPDPLEYGVLKQAVADGKLPASDLAKADKLRDKAAKALKDLVAGIAAAESGEALAALVDVDNVLSYMVAVNLTGHWDSLLGNANNDHLVFNKKTGKWGIVVWDLDNSLGSAATGGGPFDSVWNAGPDEFRKGGQSLLSGNRRPLFEKVMRFFAAAYEQRYLDFLAGVYDLHRMNDRIVTLRDRFTGGHSDDPMWETLFNFKNHRFNHARCAFDLGKSAVVTNGRPEFVSYDQKKPKCQ